MKKTPKSSNPPPLRGRAARLQGARVGGGRARHLQVKIELWHQDSRSISATIRPRPSSGFGPNCDGGRLKISDFDDRFQSDHSSLISPAWSRNCLSRSTAAFMPDGKRTMRKERTGWRFMVVGSSGSPMQRSCGTSKASSRPSDQHSSLERTPLRILLRRMLSPPQGGRVDH